MINKKNCSFFTIVKKLQFIFFEKEKSSHPISRVLYLTISSQKRERFIIYLLHGLPHDSSILPSIGISWASNPQTMVYVNLQPLAGTAL